MTCANAVSVTSRGKLVTFPPQSRKLERKPWTVAFHNSASVIVMVLPYRGRTTPLTIFREAGELF